MIQQMGSWLLLVFTAFVCCLPKSGDCQNVTVKGVIEMTVYTYNVDWSVSDSKSFKELMSDTQTATCVHKPRDCFKPVKTMNNAWHFQGTTSGQSSLQELAACDKLNHYPFHVTCCPPCTGSVASRIINKTLGEVLTFSSLTVGSRARDGLLQLYFTLQGEVTAVSVWLKMLAQRGIIVQKRPIAVLVGFYSGRRLIQVFKQEICDIRVVLKPCDLMEKCIFGECKLSITKETTTGNLVVLGYGGVFLLAILLAFIVCCCCVACRKREKSLQPDIEIKSNRNGEI